MITLFAFAWIGELIDRLLDWLVLNGRMSQVGLNDGLWWCGLPHPNISPSGSWMRQIWYISVRFALHSKLSFCVTTLFGGNCAVVFWIRNYTCKRKIRSIPWISSASIFLIVNNVFICIYLLYCTSVYTFGFNIHMQT